MSLAPRRIYKRWKARLGIRKRVGELTQELRAVFPQLHSLSPSPREGGFDSIYFLQDFSRTRFGVMRLNNPWQIRTAVYPHLPRRSPSPTERIDREWQAYSVLGPLELSPRPLWRSSDSVVCTYSSFPNLRKIMEQGAADLATAMTSVFNAIGRMHDAGIVHLDLSPGNVLVCPQTFQTLLIDFEYECRPERTFEQNCRFDWARIIEKTNARGAILEREPEVALAIESAVRRSDYQQAIRSAIELASRAA
jgi:hypothetical protein